jgi:hypothetical protein
VLGEGVDHQVGTFEPCGDLGVDEADVGGVGQRRARQPAWIVAMNRSRRARGAVLSDAGNKVAVRPLMVAHEKAGAASNVNRTRLRRCWGRLSNGVKTANNSSTNAR